MKKLILIFFPVLLMAQKPEKAVKPARVFEKINPKITVQAGFCLPEVFNLGYELQANYYPYSKKWVRLGPSVQMNNFYVVYKNWFNSNNKEKSLSSELRFNALFNVEFIPFKKSSFYVGVAPYIGYQWLNNHGTLQNPTNDLDLKWNYNIHTFDFGTRYKLGGFFGEKQRYGLESVFQMSNRGIADKSPITSFFTDIGLPTYKAYIGFNFVYRII
jgi:hypothetical protein